MTKSRVLVMKTMKTLVVIFICTFLHIPVYAENTSKCGGTIEFVKPGDPEVIDMLYVRVRNREDIQIKDEKDEDRLKDIVLHMSKDQEFIEGLNRDIEMDFVEGKRNFYSKNMKSHEFELLRKTVTQTVKLRKQCLSESK